MILWSRIVYVSFTFAVRFWTFEVLDYLVEAHGQLYDVAPNLLDRIMNALIEAMAKETSKCFQTVTLFGTGGFLQVDSDVLC